MISKDSLCFTYCQVPVIYTIADQDSLTVDFSNGATKTFNSLSLDTEISDQVFNRNGEVIQINVQIKKESTKIMSIGDYEKNNIHIKFNTACFSCNVL